MCTSYVEIRQWQLTFIGICSCTHHIHHCYAVQQKSVSVIQRRYVIHVYLRQFPYRSIIDIIDFHSVLAVRDLTFIYMCACYTHLRTKVDN